MGRWKRLEVILLAYLCCQLSELHFRLIEVEDVSGLGVSKCNVAIAKDAILKIGIALLTQFEDLTPSFD